MIDWLLGYAVDEAGEAHESRFSADPDEDVREAFENDLRRLCALALPWEDARVLWILGARDLARALVDRRLRRE